MKVKLTQKYIDHPPPVPPDKAKVEHCDTALPGLLWEQRAINQEWGSYRLRYKNSAGKTSYATVGRSCDISLTEARQKARQLKAEIQLGADPQHEARERRKGMTWDTFFTDHYLPHVKQHLRSWTNLEEMHRLRISGRLGQVKLDRIRKGEVQKFLNELKASGLSGSTCDHYGKLIRQALNVAVSWGYLDSNAVSGIKLFKEDNQVERYLEGEELQRLLKVLDADKNKMVAKIILFLLSTGARKDEVLNAKWSQIDRVKNSWLISADVSKSKKRRTVYLNEVALGILDELDTESKSKYLFTSSRTGDSFSDISKVWTRIRNKAGIPDVRLHDLRHSYASFLANSGCNEFQIQQALGHASTVTTRRYVHMSQEAMQQAAGAAADRINAALKANNS
jgi:integrase